MTSGIDVKANLDTAEQLIKKAAKEGCNLVALPEMFAIMPRGAREALEHAEKFQNGFIQQKMSHLARTLGIWIAAGSIPLKSPVQNRVYNTCIVYDHFGTVACRYDKIHLFSFDNKVESHDEASIYLPGKKPAEFILPLDSGINVRVGLGICYDLRFPELFRSYDNPDLLIIPAAFTATTGKAHWKVLLRARAIENLCYVCAPAQGGQNPQGRIFYGHSMAVDCWGQVQAVMGPNETGLSISSLETAYIRKVRSILPATRNKSISHD